MNATSTAPAAVAALDALQQDPEVASIVERERIRQLEGAELIASENYTSEAVMAAQGSILTNKYAEGLPRKLPGVNVAKAVGHRSFVCVVR